MFRLHTPETKNAHPTDFSLNDIEETTNKGSTATFLRLPRSLLSLKDIRTLCKSKPVQKQTGHLLRYELHQNWCPVMVRMMGLSSQRAALLAYSAGRKILPLRGCSSSPQSLRLCGVSFFRGFKSASCKK